VTRCYEYYCLFEKKPKKCKLSVRGQRYVKGYIKFMKGKGVQFDGQPYDKGLFYANFEKWGSEFALLGRHDHAEARKINVGSEITVVVKQGDFRELIKNVADASIDCVLTDPPYEPAFLPQWAELARESARVLKPSGFFVSYSGWMFLPQVLDYLQLHLFYYWTIPLLMKKGNHSRIFPRHIFQETKPILVFQKPPLRSQEKWIPDLLENPEADKELHGWGQGVKPLVSLLETFTELGDMVLDPLVGGGASIEACSITKRSVTAFELNEDTYNLLTTRLEGAKYG
jgi:16S rRNA G966 N2-methylase RsmD